jgi:hypothetical protein
VKHIKLFENFDKAIQLYHGSEYVSLPQDYIFLSSEKSFSEDYGSHLFVCNVDLGNIFDTLKLEHIELLYNNGIKLSEYNSAEYDYDGFIENYDFESDCYPTPMSFINGCGEQTWEAIEGYDGMLENHTKYIFSLGFDTIKVYEDGIINYYTSVKRVLSKTLLN